MYGQMTAGSWIYIGTQGILQGTYETLRSAARRRTSAARCAGQAGRHGGAGRHGRRAAAGRDDERRACSLGVEVDPTRIRAPARHAAISTRWRRSLDEAHRARVEAARRKARRVSIGAGRQCRRAARSCCARGHRSRHPHRPDLGARRAERLRSGRHVATTRRWRLRDSRSGRVHRAVATTRWRAHVRAMLELQRRGAITFDYGNNLRGAGAEGRRRRTRSTSPASCRAYIRPLSARARPVPLGRAVRRSGRHLPHRRSPARALPARRRAASLDPHGAGARPVPGIAGAHLLARLRRARQGGTALQRPGAQRRSRRRRSSSAAIISTPARSPRRIARPRR